MEEVKIQIPESLYKNKAELEKTLSNFTIEE